MIKNIGKFSIKKIIRNLYSFFVIDLKKEIRDAQEENVTLYGKLRQIQIDLLYFKVLEYFKKNPDETYKNEIDYLDEIGQIALFPYRIVKNLDKIAVEFDEKRQMFYVFHRGKKLFYPKGFSQDEVCNNYKSLMEEQCILGGGFREKEPHKYQTDEFRVGDRDVVLDIGAAEALFSLDVIDVAKKVIVFEGDEKWFEPLTATFEPFNDKAVIIKKYVADFDSEGTIRLETALKGENPERLFVKIDIEGYECKFIRDNIEIFNSEIKDIKVACATYHKEEDGKILEAIFNEMGFKTGFSDGYMIYVHDEMIRAPFFRKGILRAHRFST